MRTLRHPAFDDVTVDVPDEAAERWQLAGWLADEPEPVIRGERRPELFIPEASGRVVPRVK